MSYQEAKGAEEEQSEPSAVMERLNWQLARRDDRRVAQALYAGEEVEEMHELSEAGLLDEFFVFLEEIGMLAVVEQLDLPGVQRVLLLANEAGVLKLGTISLDGTKVHADASKRKAVSYKHLLELKAQLRAEVEDLIALSEYIDQPEVPDGLVVREEIA